jgi:hypothetical protein
MSKWCCGVGEVLCLIFLCVNNMITLLLVVLLQSASTRCLIVSTLDEVREYKLGKYLINKVLIVNLSTEDGDNE